MRRLWMLLAVVLVSSALVSISQWYILINGDRDRLVTVKVPLSRHTLSAPNTEVTVHSAGWGGDTDLGPKLTLLSQNKLTHPKNISLKELLSDEDDEEDPPEWIVEEEEPYTVLLDTGDYVLEDVDMDRTNLPPAEPPHTSQPPTHSPPHNTQLHSANQQTTNPPNIHIYQPTVWSDVNNKHSSQANIDMSSYKKENVSIMASKVEGFERHKTKTNAVQKRYYVEVKEIAEAALGEDPTALASTNAKKEVKIIQRPKLKQPPYSPPTIPPTTNPPTTPTTTSTIPTTPKKPVVNSKLPALPPTCSFLPCLQYLSSPELQIYNKCISKLGSSKKKHSPQPTCNCRFMESRGRKTVALVSLPGSGNTWLRGLLERATGICTGSIYCDRTLRQGGFCGEGLRGASLIAVKTHDTSLNWSGAKIMKSADRPMFDKAIFLIRSPFRATIAEWNRQMSRKYATDQSGSNHVKYISNKEFFGQNPAWSRHVRYLTNKWKLMMGSNLVKGPATVHAVLPIFYEDLKHNAGPEIKKILTFLDFPYSEFQLNSTLLEGYSSYYRNHTDTFDHFTSEQTHYINTVIAQTAQTLSKNVGMEIAKKVEEYFKS